MKSLERRMAAWTPRRPSRSLERELFGTATGSPAHARAVEPAWRWWVPATGTLLLLFVSLDPGRGGFGQSDRGAAAGSLGSNIALVAYADRSGHSRLNGIPAERFEWTSHELFPSSIRHFPHLETNSLRR